jgi:uncharacterized membrane protein YccC
VLVGGHPVTAAIGMFVWGVALGTAGVYGNGAAAMSLPVAWVFLILGLAAPSHGLGEATRLGALFVAGGAWAIALAWAIKAVGPDAPLAERTAQCFVLLADYLEHALATETGATWQAPSTTDGYGPSRETRVRSAIAAARLLAVETRRRQGAASRAGQRLVVLIELADQVFLLGSVLAETWNRRADAASSSAHDSPKDEAGRGGQGHVFVAGARAVARVLARREYGAPAPRVEVELERLRAESAPAVNAEASPSRAVPAAESPATASPDDDRAEIRGRVASALTQALRIAIGQMTPTPVMPELEPTTERRSSPWNRFLAPLRSCLDRRSVVGRHALRYGLVTAVAVAIDKSFAVPFGYWIALTVTVVLKPYAGSTLTRAGQRLCGTIAGVAVGVVLLQLLTAPLARVAVTTAACFATLALLLVNYGMAIFFFSIGIVPLEGLTGAQTSSELGMVRVINTCVGGALALAGGYLLWPSFERHNLPAVISSALSSMSLYADRVLAVPAGEPSSPALVEAARRRAGLDHTTLQASFQRVVAEPGEDRARLEASLLLVVTLQRLLVSLNVLRQMGPAVEPGRPEWTRFRELVSRGLTDLTSALESRSRPAAMPEIPSEALGISSRLVARAAPHEGFLGQEIERVAWQVSALRAAVGRIVAGGLERQ